MLYYTNKARTNARIHIQKLRVKLANTKSTETLTLEDIRNLISYLNNMDEELKREIRENI